MHTSHVQSTIPIDTQGKTTENSVIINPDKKTPTHTTNVKVLEGVSSSNMEFEEILNGLYKPELVAPNMKYDTSQAFTDLAMLQAKLATVAKHGSIQDILCNNKILKNSYEQIHQKIDEQLEKKAQAEEQQRTSSILSWLGTIFAIVFAAVMFVFTAGASTALLVGAVIGLTLQVLDATGAIAKITEFVANQVEKNLIANGMSPSEAKEKAQIIAVAIIQTVLIIVTIVTTAIGGGFNPNSALSNANTLKNAVCQAIKSTVSQISKILSKLSIKNPQAVAKIITKGIINNLHEISYLSRKITKTGIATQGLMQAANGGLQISTGVAQEKSTVAQAERMKLLQSQKMLEFCIQQDGGHAENQMVIHSDVFQQVLQMLKSNQDVQNKIIGCI